MSEYASPFPVLPHTLSDEDAKTLRSAVYAHYQQGPQDVTKSAGDGETEELSRLTLSERLLQVATEQVVEPSQAEADRLYKESPRQTGKDAKMGLFRSMARFRKARMV